MLEAKAAASAGISRMAVVAAGRRRAGEFSYRLSLKCRSEEPKSALRPAALCRRATAAAAALATSRAARWPRAMSCTPPRPAVSRNRCSMGRWLPWARRLLSPCRTGEPSAAAQVGDPTRPDELTDIAGKPAARAGSADQARSTRCSCLPPRVTACAVGDLQPTAREQHG